MPPAPAQPAPAGMILPAPPRARRLDFALLGLLAALWGSTYLFAKIALEEIPPLTLVAARVSIAAAMLLAVMAAKREALPRAPRTWGALLVQACFNSIFAWTVLAWAQQHIAASLASVLNSTAPIFVFLITVIVTRHEPATPVRLVGALAGVAGVVLIVGVEAAAGLDASALAAAAALFSAFLYGCAAVYGRRLHDLAPTAAAAGTMLCATAALVPAALLLEQPWRLRPSLEALAATATIGVACTGLALLLYFRLLRTLGSMGVASQAYLRAGFGALLGVLVLGERLTPALLAGMALAVLGVALINRPARRRAPLAARRDRP